MLQLRLFRTGKRERVFSVDGDVAVVGRAPDCDVCIDDPRISKNHARILRGVVVIDLGSTNGTWVNDVRINEPTLVLGSRFRVGTGDHAFEIDVDAAPAAPVAPAPEPEVNVTMVEVAKPAARPAERAEKAAEAAKPPVEAPAAGPPASQEERERAARLVRELDELRKQFDAKKAKASSELAEARLEAAGLKQRLDSLKVEVEARAKEGDEAVQARLLQSRLEAVEKQNAGLRQQVAELEAAAAKPAAAPDAAPAVPTVDFVSRMSRDLARLKQENKELKQRVSAGGEPGGAQIGGAAGGGAAGGGATPGAAMPAAAMFVQLQSDLREVRRQKAALEDELVHARAALAAASSAARVAAPAPEPAPVPDRPAAGPPRAGGGAAGVLPSLLADEVDGLTPPANSGLDDYLLFVSVRFLRVAEKLVTYVARELIQQLDLHTILPETDVNFRGVARDLLAKPDDAVLRRKLDGYLRELQRWIVPTLFAYKNAASEYVRDLKKSLSADVLTADKPMPRLGLREVELWKRASARLNELSPDTMDDGIYTLARAAAQRMLDSGDTGPKRATRKE